MSHNNLQCHKMLFEATAYISFGQPSRTCERPTLSSGRDHWRASRKLTVTTACTNVHKQQEKHGGKTVSSWEHPRTKHRKILVHTQNTPLDYCYCIDRFFASTQNTSIGMAKKQNIAKTHEHLLSPANPPAEDLFRWQCRPVGRARAQENIL